MMKKIQLDDGYQFGIGAFETICVYRGVPLFCQAHLQRIQHALRRLQIAKTVTRDEVFSALRGTKDDAEYKVLKIIVSEENTLFLTRDYPYTESQYENGFQVAVSAVKRNETSAWVQMKTLACGEVIWEKRRYAERGFDEVLFLNGKGDVAECATSNFFIVRQGRIRTPDSASGILPGVVRQYMVRQAGVQTGPLAWQEVSRAEEVFLTNSLLGVMPVVRVGSYRFPVGPVTKQWMNLYKKEVQRQYEMVRKERRTIRIG